MPVEIRELVIRAEIQEGSKGPSKDPNHYGDQKAISQEERAQLIEECVAQVLAVLDKQKER